MRQATSTFTLCIVLTGLAFGFSSPPAPPPEWAPAAARVLSKIMQEPVAYLQNGPQNIFYLNTLPRDREEAVLQTLSTYRTDISAGGSIVLLGLEPEAAYWTTSTLEPAWLSNTTVLGMYASMVDGRSRFAAGPNTLGPTDGCVSSSNTTGSFLRCRSNSTTTFESSCQWYGDELICKSY